MNSKTYLKLIAKQFGGALKSDLEAKLRKLVYLVIKEQSQIKPAGASHYIDMPVQKPVNKPVAVHNHVNRYQNMSSYEKAMNLIRNFNSTGWKHVSEVPGELFKDFWAIAEMHPEIIFDEDRQWQYFKVEDFKNKSFLNEREKQLETVA